MQHTPLKGRGQAGFNRAGMKRDRNGLWIAMRKLYGECPDKHVERCLGGAITVPATQPVVPD